MSSQMNAQFVNSTHNDTDTQILNHKNAGDIWLPYCHVKCSNVNWKRDDMFASDVWNSHV